MKKLEAFQFPLRVIYKPMQDWETATVKNRRPYHAHSFTRQWKHSSLFPLVAQCPFI